MGNLRLSITMSLDGFGFAAVTQLPGAGQDFIVADRSAREGKDLVVERLAARYCD